MVASEMSRGATVKLTVRGDVEPSSDQGSAGEASVDVAVYVPASVAKALPEASTPQPAVEPSARLTPESA